MSDRITGAVDRICDAVQGVRERRIVLTEMRVIVAVVGELVGELLEKSMGHWQCDPPPALAPSTLRGCCFALPDGAQCEDDPTTLAFIADLESGVFALRGRCGAHPFEEPIITATTRPPPTQ